MNQKWSSLGWNIASGISLNGNFGWGFRWRIWRRFGSSGTKIRKELCRRLPVPDGGLLGRWGQWWWSGRRVAWDSSNFFLSIPKEKRYFDLYEIAKPFPLTKKGRKLKVKSTNFNQNKSEYGQMNEWMDECKKSTEAGFFQIYFLILLAMLFRNFPSIGYSSVGMSY